MQHVQILVNREKVDLEFLYDFTNKKSISSNFPYKEYSEQGVSIPKLSEAELYEYAKKYSKKGYYCTVDALLVDDEYYISFSELKEIL